MVLFLSGGSCAALTSETMRRPRSTVQFFFTSLCRFFQGGEGAPSPRRIRRLTRRSGGNRSSA
jgi:hypothetical protein